MSDIELVIKIPERIHYGIEKGITVNGSKASQILIDAVKNGIPLPKGHGDLFDKTEILRFLKCPEYENCDWRNCSDCNQSHCINLNNIDSLIPIIEANKP